MNKIQILKKARELIEDGREQFLCVAIRKVTGNIGIGHDIEKVKGYDAKYLLKIIDKCVGSYYTVNVWLDRNYPGQFDAYDPEFMRVYRLAWIDTMIGQIERGEL